MIDKKEFGRRLKSARERQELLQRDIAQYLDVTPNAVGNWEQGLCYPNTGFIDDLCVALKVSPNWLFRSADWTPPKPRPVAR